jgi:hypothetical protein
MLKPGAWPGGFLAYALPVDLPGAIYWGTLVRRTGYIGIQAGRINSPKWHLVLPREHPFMTGKEIQINKTTVSDMSKKRAKKNKKMVGIKTNIWFLIIAWRLV